MARKAKSKSQSYAESNLDGTRQLYYKRLLYKEYMKDLNQRHIVDFYFGEKLLFGRVDRYYTPMILKSDTENFNKFDTSAIADTSRSFSAVNFVVDAFKDMAIAFQKARFIGQITPGDQFLSTPLVYRSFESPVGKYNDYSRSYHNALQGQFEKRNIKVRDFSDFINHMKDIILTSGEGVRRYPFTMPAYIKSRLCPISVTGLAIEIADSENLHCANDADKIDKFVNSPNWEFYLNACNDNGFMIDMNAPWRIVADIDAPVMQERARTYQSAANDTSSLISAYYRNAYMLYYASFKTILLKLYNEIRDPMFVVPIDCSADKTISKTVMSQVYTGDRLAEEFPEEYFLRLYCAIRFAEEESTYTEQQQANLINEAVSLLRVDDHRVAVFAFERILNKTFDYRGSITYIRGSEKLIAEERAIRLADTPGSEVPAKPAEYRNSDSPGSLDEERAAEGGMAHPGGGRWVGEK